MYIFVFTDVHFDLYAAGLVHHTQYHRILPTGRHLNFALHFKTFMNFWLNLETFVRARPEVTHSFRPGVSKVRPAGQIRPAKPFHPAREAVLSMMKK